MTPTPKGTAGSLLLVVAITLALAGFVPDLMHLTNLTPVSYPDQPFEVTNVARESTLLIGMTINRTVCYDEPWELDVLSFPITARALVNTRTQAKHYLPPGEGFAAPGCRSDNRPVELETTAPSGTYYLEGISDIQSRWGRSQVYWRTVDFVVP